MPSACGKPGVSVVIPCWNVAEWLPRCLDEVFAALPQDGEVIAVDDGSTDATPSVLRDFAARRPDRMEVLAQEHSGVSAARNKGLDACRGEYVFFVDPDDGVEPGFFEEMRGAMASRGADYCVTAFRHRLEAGGFRDEALKGGYDFATNAEVVAGFLPRIFGYSLDDVRAWYGGVPLFSRREMAAVWRAAFRLDVIRANGIRFDETVELYEDMVFNAEYLLRAKSMTCVPKPLYRVTDRDTGAMRAIPRDAARYVRN